MFVMNKLNVVENYCDIVLNTLYFTYKYKVLNSLRFSNNISYKVC